MPTAKRLLRGLALTATGVALTLLVAAGALYAWLQSDAGGDWARRQAEAVLSTPGEREVAIEALGGRLPHALRIPRLTVGDAEGAWLRAEDLAIDWRLGGLLRGRLEVAMLSAESISVLRPPEAPEAEEAESGLSIPKLPVEIVVERLAVETLDLAPGILGEAARFEIDGGSRAQPDGSLDARLNIERSDGGTGRLAAEAAYRAAEDGLSLTLELSEAEGGLSDYLLDLPGRPAVDLRLAGKGPLSDWRGKLTARLEGLLSGEADLTLRRGADIAFDLSAEAQVTPATTEPPWPLLAGAQSLRIEGAWRGAGTLSVTKLSLEGDALVVEGTGALDPAGDRIEAELTAELRDDGPLARWLGAERIDGSRAVVTLGGSLSRPRIAAELRAAEAAVDGVAIEGLRVEAQFQAREDLFAAPARGRLTVVAGIEDLEVRDDQELQSALGRAFEANFEGKLDLAASVLEAERLALTGEAFEVEASGHLGLDDGRGEIETKAGYFTLSRLDAITGLGLKGSAEIEGPLKIEGFGSRLAGALRGRLRDANSEVEIVGRLLSAEAALESHLELAPESLTLRGMKITTAAAEASGDLALLEGFERLSGSFHLSLPETGLLSEALGVTLEGAGAVTARLEGPSGDPKVTGTASAEALRLEGVEFSKISAAYRTTSLAPTVAAQIEAEASSPLGPLSAATELSLEEQDLRLSSLQASAPDGKVTGTLAAPLGGGPVIGKLRADFRDLGGVLALAGLSGGGKGEAELELSETGGRQSARLAAAIENASLKTDDTSAPLQAARLALTLEAEDPVAGGPGRFELEGRGLSRDTLTLDGLAVTGDGRASDLALSLRAEGHWIEPLAIEAKGRLALSDSALTAELREAEGKALGESFRLAGPARLELAGESLRLSGFSAGIGEGRLAAEAALEPKSLQASLKLDDLPARLVDLAAPLGLDGRISGEASIEGPRTAPRGRLSAQGRDLRTSRLTGAPASEITLTGSWQDGRAQLDGRVRAAEAAEAEFSADLPLRLDPRGLAPGLPEDQPIQGRFSWKGETGRLLAFLPVADHRLQGQGDIDIALRGTLAKPRVEGQIAVSGAEYESLEAGTLLKDLDLLVELSKDSARIARLSASDGGDGALSAEGQIALSPESGFAFDVSTELEDFHLVRRDEVTGAASGQLRIEGDAKAARLTGRLVTDRVEVSILGSLPPEVVKLDVIEEDGTGRSPGGRAVSERQAPYGLGLDMAVEFPQQVFVRGRGLDSEWSGRLLIKGSAEAPRVSGEITLVRGRLSIVGKSFELQSGRIKLPDDPGAEPELDIVSQYETEDLVVTARVTGPVSNPEIALTSRPELPKDEIVSRVLFNKGVGNLTAVEAAQLAVALPELTGGSGGFDIMGFLRQTVGVDVLQLDTTEGKDGPAPAVKAGKYVTEEVYLGVKQGATIESSSINVEVELTPNISVESEVSQTGETKSGVKFKLDY